MFEQSNLEHVYANSESWQRDGCRPERQKRVLATLLRTVSVCIFLNLIAAGCVRSLHPFCEKGQATFEPKLVGVWEADSGTLPGRWVFSRYAEKAAYRLEQTLNEKTNVFHVRLIKIDNRNYLDLSLSSSDDAFDHFNIFAGFHLLPVHTVAQLNLEDDTATISLLDHQWLDKRLREDPAALRHERRGPTSVVLTASTEELQRFIEKHAEDVAAWHRKVRLERQDQQRPSPDAKCFPQ